MKNVYTVGQVNAYIKNMFAQDYMLRQITVSGEASNVKYHSSGHLYFTMKDKSGALSCIMYAGNVAGMNFRLTEGMQIEVTGSVSVYEKTGVYQLYASSVRHAGAGELYERFDRLKEELKQRGMFDEMYKRPIPKYVRTVGIVTSPTGAAVQDIMQISRRRNPYVQLILYPALVQGSGAKESIVAGIRTLENLGVDVIIVGRGGGSIEDLWAFNEECVAEAIFDCTVPVISAVGHETDWTIADYVSDLRAPTPSAAAELAVFSYEEYANMLDEMAFRLTNGINKRIDKEKNYVNHLSARLESLSPMAQVKLKRQAYMNMLERLDYLMENKINSSRNRYSLYIEKMKAASPLNRLAHGYAGIADESGRKIKSAADVKKGDELTLTLRDGCIKAVADKVEIRRDPVF